MPGTAVEASTGAGLGDRTTAGALVASPRDVGRFNSRALQIREFIY